MFTDLFIPLTTTVPQPHLLLSLLSHVLMVINRHIHQNKVILLHRLAIHTDPIYSNGWKLPSSTLPTLTMVAESFQLPVMVSPEVGEAVEVQSEIDLLSSASQLLTTTNICPLHVVSKVPRLIADSKLYGKCKSFFSSPLGLFALLIGGFSGMTSHSL